MFSFEKGDSNSFTQRRRGARGGAKFVKCVRYFGALVLLASFLVLGCKEDAGGKSTTTNDDTDGGTPSAGFQLDEKLIGTWTSEYYDGYIITATRLSYGYGVDSIEYAGTIRYAEAFSGEAGVIIFQYDADKKPVYYAGYDPDTYEPIGDPLPLKGNFIGVYYKALKPGVSMQIGTAYVDGGAEEKTLAAAKKVFTVHKEGDYVSYYGTYFK